MHYISHLAKDRRLKKLLDREPFSLKQEKIIWLHLCGSIMSQQLSVKVADVIWKRFLALYDNSVTPQQVINTPITTLRSIGLSNAKANYVQNVARFELEKGMDSKKLKKMADQDVIDYLAQIKGVGRWTAEMILIFALGREDVFSVGDLGIQQAMIKLYKLDNSDKKRFLEDLTRISLKWSPYRSYACLHLWHWKDNSPVKK